MTNNTYEIKLNDILFLPDVENTKIRFNLMFEDNWNPIELFKSNKIDILLKGTYWNYSRQKSYKEGQTVIGFMRIKQKANFWLLFHIGQVTRDLNVFNGPGYEYETLAAYEKYFGRLVVEYKNTSQNMVRNAASVIDNCYVSEILPDIFDNDIFPGYDRVDISWEELSRVITKKTWRTALQNQKGVYLLTDTSNGKRYVGSAYGEDMILGRWESYIRTGHGGNIGLRSLGFSYIKENFRFSILDIYKSTISDDSIIEREHYWKRVLLSRDFGYNEN